MNPLFPGALKLWAVLLTLSRVHPSLPQAGGLSTVAAILACLVTATASASKSSKTEVPQTQNPYIPTVVRLYEQTRYEEALSKLEKALAWKSNEEQEQLWLKLMKGVLQAELAQVTALDSFEEALVMNPEAQLPVKGSRRLRRLFEQARHTAGLPTDAALLAEERDPVMGPPPRRQGLSLSVRGEMDALGHNLTKAVTPAVGLGYTREKLGGELTLLVQSSPGLRAEGQYHPLTLGWVRPYAGLGATTFFRERDEQGAHTFFGGVSGRVTLGADVQWNSHMYGFAGVAYERSFTAGDHYRSQSVLFSVGVGTFL